MEGNTCRPAVGPRDDRQAVCAWASPDLEHCASQNGFAHDERSKLQLCHQHTRQAEIMAHTSPMALDRRVSPSPPPQPLSKRDKRRNNITDKLSDMIQTFTQDQHQHYRAQLQAIQVDMTMILRANPYENSPLDDSAEDVEREIENVTGGSLPNTDAAVKDYLALAGKRYHEYVQQINHALEQRDADLTALQVRDNSLRPRHSQRLTQAEPLRSRRRRTRKELELQGPGCTTRTSRAGDYRSQPFDKQRHKEARQVVARKRAARHCRQFCLVLPPQPIHRQHPAKSRRPSEQS